MKARRVTCINNEGYPASLVKNTVYETLPDDESAKHGLIRVIDESGEDYLYPESYFVPAESLIRPTVRFKVRTRLRAKPAQGAAIP